MSKNQVAEGTSTKLSIIQVQSAMPMVQKRLDELKSLDVHTLTNDEGGHILDSLSQKINTTLRRIFPVDSIEYQELQISTFRPRFYAYYSGQDTSIRGNLDVVRSKVGGGVAMLTTLLETLEEQLEYEEPDSESRAIRAYSDLDLHPEIERAATKLYQDGHYANAVEAAVKALNGLVRLRSGLEHDGTTLMERAFNPKSPVLKFNSLADQSGKDEQKGFMQLFSGAVSGLRNPRAHSFLQDSAERALEFIAFISLLAKLLDEANK